MKKKHLNIVLVILMVVIYGGIFFKFFGKKEMVLPQNENMTNFEYQDIKLKKNEFTLVTIKNDPFKASKFKKPKSSREIPKESKTKKKKSSLINKKVWPAIIYYGFVKNDVHSKPLVFLKVNNRVFRKREDEFFENLHIEKVYNDSIKITFNKETKTILKLNEDNSDLFID